MKTIDSAENYDNLPDQKKGTSSLPEVFVEALEPYVVYSRIDILANLHLLIDRHVLTTVYFNNGENFTLTRFLGVNPEFEELIFDLALDRQTNEKLLASDGLTVVAFLDQIKVQFSVNRAELTQFQGSPSFRVRTPRSILRLQRRAAFRARTQIVHSPYVLLSSGPNAARLRIADISATGCAFVTQARQPTLAAGMCISGCQLELEVNASFDADIEIRHVSAFQDSFRREMYRAGCRLVNISGDAKLAIQRYVNKLAVGGRHDA